MRLSFVAVGLCLFAGVARAPRATAERSREQFLTRRAP